MSAERTIRYFFTLHSPWAYLGHEPLLAIARRRGARIDYTPVSLNEVFPASGGLPLARRHPARQAYRMVELKRWKARLGREFNLRPRHWPIDISRVDRCAAALVARGRAPEPFVSRAFAAMWEQELDLADPDTIGQILAGCGHDPDEILEEASGEAIGELYAANTSRALADGVFGSPTYGLDGELFWGQDRLSFLDEALATGRAPILP